jgi:hypothetical protein
MRYLSLCEKGTIAKPLHKTCYGAVQKKHGQCFKNTSRWSVEFVAFCGSPAFSSPFPAPCLSVIDHDSQFRRLLFADHELFHRLSPFFSSFFLLSPTSCLSVHDNYSQFRLLSLADHQFLHLELLSSSDIVHRRLPPVSGSCLPVHDNCRQVRRLPFTRNNLFHRSLLSCCVMLLYQDPCLPVHDNYRQVRRLPFADDDLFHRSLLSSDVVLLSRLLPYPHRPRHSPGKMISPNTRCTPLRTRSRPSSQKRAPSARCPVNHVRDHR